MVGVPPWSRPAGGGSTDVVVPWFGCTTVAVAIGYLRSGLGWLSADGTAVAVVPCASCSALARISVRTAGPLPPEFVLRPGCSPGP